ncbi:neural cell adhesion molecule L1-like protein isoform X1 [Phyllostomus hastatus]|uniref:neural cell adhesion molecule L1-like protein isoform X1 n=1 Tax=Phyllostomus hastatus TaxID=9423 RepID=UPI001E68559D|nr:neural cell adhesion molecule L1-like protein isoform X1 [Phyllostomus hastatus]XP_045712822.1 neural cell adhesion molecule L1-like protein isoform X1 [Phyllostomus hastatus]XP_045712823.1 neural cell adhesion molecule L1-like protein isoform X1 [Phyllostomus hastatus]XP_045712824.1 neural cell adhesion molecule L1-like protein isoform X1 [Phyllostomus hastatus]XP_045712825.1 neural cell adhesion molecule L1-like protein isoform X1 [Phyllostomus hastatus]XP_045712827.1 neural cell adhesion
MEAPSGARGSAVSPLILFLLELAAAAATEIPLSVPQVPTITKQSKVLVAFPFDEHFQIECEAKGNPPPQFTWTKDDKPFDLSDPRVVASNHSGTFRIPNEGHVAHFQGRYRCFASNRLGAAASEEMEFIVPNVPKFPKEKIEPLEVEEGDSVVLRCKPPAGLPPLHIYWMNIELEHIEQDERVHMSQEGDLYFANVEERDSRSDYCCFAAFPRLRTIVQKMPMKLTVSSLKRNSSGPSTETGSEANSIKQREPKLLLPPDAERGPEHPVTVLRGDTLLLECFAEGLPTPQIEWEKMGGDLPRGRETREGHGKVLKVEKVSYEDRGRYRCTATNPLGAATHDFHVTVEEPPRWVKKPQSGVYSTGTSVILLCEAEGEPKPTIRWRVNGLPIEENPFAGDVVFPGEVSFTNLQPNHSAVYQCEAANAHGTILATANVDVVDIPPLIQTDDGEAYAAVVGSSVSLLCDFFASPQAVVSWLRVEELRPVAGPRHHVYDNGTLRISGATEEDAGSYTCWVENAKGKTAVTASLDIREATAVRVSPENPRVHRSRTLELRCESRCDPHLAPSLTLAWSKDGDALLTNGTEDGRVVLDGARLTLSNVTPEDQGVYACTARTTLDSVADRTHVTVLDVPDPPENLRLSERQNRSVRLAWDAGDDHNSNVTEYVVEFEGDREAPGRWAALTTVRGEGTSVLLRLAPYVRYRFRVVAVNEVGRSRPSRPSDHHETPPAAPDKNPQNIRVQASQPKEMIIKWEPLKPLEQNGPGLEYRVAWRPQGAPAEWQEETVREHSLRVMTPAVYAPYDVQVQAVNRLGAGPEPQPVTLYSGEDYPDAAPEVQGVEVVNSTLVRVTWSSVPKDRVHGQLRGYQITWWKTRSLLDGRPLPREARSLRLPGPRGSGMLPALDAFSEFRLTVLAYNSKGAGPESEPYTFQTPEGVPEQPAFLKVVKVDRDAATVAWGLPEKLSGHLVGFLLQYQTINDTEEIGELHAVNLTAAAPPRWRLSGLNSSTKYKLYLRACTARGCGKAVTEETATLGAGGKGTGPTSAGVNVTQQGPPLEAPPAPGAEPVVRLLTKTWVDNNSIFEDVVEARGREHAGLYADIATQGWFIGLMCAVAALTLVLLTVCFVKRNRGGKYSVKEKEDLHPDPEVQSGKDETFGDYSDSDEKPLRGSPRSLHRDTQATESADSLVQYGDGDQRLFSEDGSFIGAYAGSKERGSAESNASSAATFPLRA